MERYGQLVYKYLKNNKKRTVSTILGVAMGAILIFAVLNIVFCNIKSGLDNARNAYQFDAVFYNLSQTGVNTVMNSPDVAAAYIGGFDEKTCLNGGMVFVADFNNNPYNIVLKDGRYPENKNEVIANVTTETGYKTGDIVTLLSGESGLRDDMEFRVVGTYTYKADYMRLSAYEYSNISYIGRVSDMPGYFQAVYVRYKNPYLLVKNTKKIAVAVGSNFYINDSVAYYYNQTSDGSIQAVFAALIFALIVIIACMAAFVIKNTLRLSVAERMRDYGVLRCAGASLKQLKGMIVKEALIIGGISSVIGIVISYMGLLVVSALSEQYDFKHFYLLGAVITVLVCLITMLISTIEPCKMIKRLTPVEAVRNYVKVSENEKIKSRKAGIITKIFGVGGAYAYKNALRNPKQFVTRVLSLTLGIVLFTCTQTLCDTISVYIEDETGVGRSYYNVLIDYSASDYDESYYDMDTAPSVEDFCKNRDAAVSELKRLPAVKDSVDKINVAYSDGYCFTTGMEKKDFADIYTEDTNKKFISGETAYPEDEGDEEALRRYMAKAVTPMTGMLSHDADMFQAYKPYLVEGTCDVSELGEDGIILYNKMNLWKEDEDTGLSRKTQIDCMNLKVGDTVSFVAAPKSVYDKTYEAIRERYYELHKEDEDIKKELEMYGDDEKTKKDVVTAHHSIRIKYDTYSTLYQEGYIKTYTVKGIVSEAILYSDGTPAFIMTNEQFDEFMPEWTDCYDIGMWGCHADGLDNDVYHILEKNNAYSYYLYYSGYFKQVDTVKNGCSIILLFVLIFITINIFNNTSSSMVFRKGEFALLRCIGMSKRKLTYVVMLEGLLATIFASVLGIGISVLVVLAMKAYMKYMGFFSFIIPYGRVGLAIVLLFIIMSLASWIPLKSIKKEIAPALAEADE